MLTKDDKKKLSHLAKNYPDKVGETRKIATNLSSLRETLNKESKKYQVAQKMKRNDSDALKSFSRKHSSTGRPLYLMPEGNYKKHGKRYERQDEPLRGEIHG